MDDEDDQLYEFSSRPLTPGEKSAKVPVKFQVVTRTSPCAKSECISVSPSAPLTKIRKLISSSFLQHFDNGFVFLIRSREVLHSKEHQISLFDVLPKVPFESKPSTNFRFPSVRYKKLPFEYAGERYMVECACVVFLCDRSSVSHWKRDDLYRLLGATEVEGFDFIPFDILSQKRSLTDYRLCKLHEYAATDNEKELVFLTSQIHDECKIDQLRDHRLATPLHYAAANGHTKICSILLSDLGQDMLFCKDIQKRTPLHYALRRKRFKTVQLLLRWQPDLAMVDYEGVSCAHILKNYFTCAELDEIVRGVYLKTVTQDVILIFLVRALEKKAVRSTKNVLKCTKSISKSKDMPFGRSLLHLAATFAPKTVIETLVTLGCEITEKDEVGYLPFHIACQYGQLDILDSLYFESMTDFEAEFALQLALRRNNLFCVKRIGELRENMKFRDDTLQWLVNLMETKGRKTFSCLFPCVVSRRKLLPRFTITACLSKNTNTLQLLIENGVDINFQDLRGRSLFHEAAVSGHTNVIECILQHEGNCLLQDWRGATPLHYACSNGHIEIVKLIMSHDTNSASLHDIAGRTPFLCALQNKQVDICEYLLLKHSLHINVTASDRTGKNVLHYCGTLSETLLRRVLEVFKQKGVPLSTGTDPDIQDTDLFLLPSDCKLWACRTADSYHELSIVNEHTLEDGVAEINGVQPAIERKKISDISDVYGGWYSGRNTVSTGKGKVFVKRFIPSAEYLPEGKVRLVPFQHHRYIVESETDKNEVTKRRKARVPSRLYLQCTKCTKFVKSSRHTCWAGCINESTRENDLFSPKQLSPFEWSKHSGLEDMEHPVFSILTDKALLHIKTFLDSDKDCLQAEDCHGRTMLEASVAKLQPKVVKLCLSRVSDVQSLDKLLHSAIKVPIWTDDERKRKAAIIQYILEANANPGVELNDATPLELACKMSDKTTVELLLNRGACPFVGFSIHLSVYNGNIATLKLLLNHKCDSNDPQCSYGSEERNRVASIRSGVLQCAALSEKPRLQIFELLKAHIPDLFKSKKLLTSKLIKKSRASRDLFSSEMKIDHGPPLNCLVENHSIKKLSDPLDKNRKHYKDIASFLIKEKTHKGEIRLTKKGSAHLECICFKKSLFSGHSEIAGEIFRTSYKVIINCLSSDTTCKAWEDENVNISSTTDIYEYKYIFKIPRVNLNYSPLVVPIMNAYKHFYIPVNIGKPESKSKNISNAILAKGENHNNSAASSDDEGAPQRQRIVFDDAELLLERADDSVRKKINVLFRLLKFLGNAGNFETFVKIIEEAPALFAMIDRRVTTHRGLPNNALCKSPFRGISSAFPFWPFDLSDTMRFSAFSLLAYAIKDGNTDMVKRIMDASIPPDVNINGPVRYMDLAAFSGNLTAFKLLVSRGSEPDLRTLMFCCRGAMKRYNILKHCLYGELHEDRSEFAVVNGVDGVSNSRSGIAKIIIKNFVDVNERHRCYGTPLHLAIETKMWDFVDYLLEKGADPLLKCDRGSCIEILLLDMESPKNICTKCIDICQEHLIYCKKKYLSTLITFAARRREEDTLKTLLFLLQERMTYKTAVKIMTLTGVSRRSSHYYLHCGRFVDLSHSNAMHWIVQRGHNDSFQKLIDMFSAQDILKLDVLDDYSCTPVWYSIFCQRYSYTKALLFLGFTSRFKRAIPNFDVKRIFRSATTKKTKRSVQTYVYPSGAGFLSCGVAPSIIPGSKHFRSVSFKQTFKTEHEIRTTTIVSQEVFKRKKNIKRLCVVAEYAKARKTSFAHAAAVFGETDLIQEMVENKFVDIDQVDTHKMTMLDYCLLNGHSVCANFCFRHSKLRPKTSRTVGSVIFYLLAAKFTRDSTFFQLAIPSKYYNILPERYQTAVSSCRTLFVDLSKRRMFSKHKKQHEEVLSDLLLDILKVSILKEESAFLLASLGNMDIFKKLLKLKSIQENEQFVNALLVFMSICVVKPRHREVFLQVIRNVKNIKLQVDTITILKQLGQHDVYVETAVLTCASEDIVSSAFLIACKVGNCEYSRLLFNHLMKKHKFQKETSRPIVNKALIIALLHTQSDVASLCIEYGADSLAEVPSGDIQHYLVKKNDMYLTPIHVCIIMKNDVILGLLLQRVNSETTDVAENKRILKHCLASLETAAQAGNVTIFKTIEETLVNNFKYILSPAETMVLLLTSLRFRHSDIACLLLEKPGLDYLKSWNQKTAMHLAAMSGLVNIILTLKQKCPRLTSQQDDQGLLPVDYAQSFGHIEATEILSPQETPMNDIYIDRHIGGFRSLVSGNAGLPKTKNELYPSFKRNRQLSIENVLKLGHDKAALQFLNSYYPKHRAITNTDDLRKFITICCKANCVKTLAALCERLPSSDFLHLTALKLAVTSGNLTCFHTVIDMFPSSLHELTSIDSDSSHITAENILQAASQSGNLHIFKNIWERCSQEKKEAVGDRLLAISIALSNYDIRNFLLGEVNLPQKSHTVHITKDIFCSLCLMDCCLGWSKRYLTKSEMPELPFYRQVNELEHYKRPDIDRWPLNTTKLGGLKHNILEWLSASSCVNSDALNYLLNSMAFRTEDVHSIKLILLYPKLKALRVALGSRHQSTALHLIDAFYNGHTNELNLTDASVVLEYAAANDCENVIDFLVNNNPSLFKQILVNNIVHEERFISVLDFALGAGNYKSLEYMLKKLEELKLDITFPLLSEFSKDLPPKIQWFCGNHKLGDQDWTNALTARSGRLNLADVWLTANEKNILVKRVEGLAQTADMLPPMLEDIRVRVDKEGFARQSSLKQNSETWLNAFVCSQLVLGHVYDTLKPEVGRNTFDAKSIHVWCLPESSTEEPQWIHNHGHESEMGVKILNLNNNRESPIVVHDERIHLNQMESRLKREVKENVIPQTEKMLYDILPGVKVKVAVNWTSVDVERHSMNYTTILRMLTGDVGGGPLAGLADAIERSGFLISESEDLCGKSLREEITSVFNTYGDIVVQFAKPGQEVTTDQNKWLFCIEGGRLVKSHRGCGPLDFVEAYYTFVLQAQTSLSELTEVYLQQGKHVWDFQIKTRHFHQSLDMPPKSLQSLMSDLHKLKHGRENMSAALNNVYTFYQCLQWLRPMEIKKPIRLNFSSGRIARDIFRPHGDHLNVTIPLEANVDIDSLIDHDIVDIGEQIIKENDDLRCVFDKAALEVSDFSAFEFSAFEFYLKAKYQGKNSLGGLASVYNDKVDFKSFIGDIINWPNMALWREQANVDIPDGLWYPAIYDDITNGKSFEYLLVLVPSAQTSKKTKYTDHEGGLQFKIMEKLEIRNCPTDECFGIWYYVSLEDFCDSDKEGNNTVQLLSLKRSIYRWINASHILAYFKSHDIYKQIPPFGWYKRGPYRYVNGMHCITYTINPTELVTKPADGNPQKPLIKLLPQTSKEETMLMLDKKLTKLAEQFGINLVVDWNDFLITGKQIKVKTFPYKAALAIFESWEKLKYDCHLATGETWGSCHISDCSLIAKFNQCSKSTIAGLNTILFRSTEPIVAPERDSMILVKNNTFGVPVKIEALSDYDLCVSLSCESKKTEVKPFNKTLELAFIKCFIRQEVRRVKSELSELLRRLSVNVKIDVPLIDQNRVYILAQYEQCRDSFLKALHDLCFSVPEIKAKLSEELLRLDIKIDGAKNFKSQKKQNISISPTRLISFTNGQMVVKGTPHSDVKAFTQHLYDCFSLTPHLAVTPTIPKTEMDKVMEAGEKFVMAVTHSCSISLKFGSEEDVFSQRMKVYRHEFYRDGITFVVGEHRIPVPIRLNKSYAIGKRTQRPLNSAKKEDSHFNFSYTCKVASREVRVIALCSECSSFLPILTTTGEVPAGESLVINRR